MVGEQEAEKLQVVHFLRLIKRVCRLTRTKEIKKTEWVVKDRTQSPEETRKVRYNDMSVMVGRKSVLFGVDCRRIREQAANLIWRVDLECSKTARGQKIGTKAHTRRADVRVNGNREDKWPQGPSQAVVDVVKRVQPGSV
jgi:hypothetical protein